MKSAILVAFHFPPVQVSSGLQRALANSNYLPDSGWQPLVLSAHARAYSVTSDTQMQDIRQGTVVKRGFALDTRRHFSLGGKYPGFLSLPDRWVSWWIGGVISGVILSRKYRPKVIWSTYPIATAHLIGLTLHKLTGLPWVADFRDSMTEDNYPPNPRKRRIYQWLERQTISHCSRAIFTTPGAKRMYQERYPNQHPDKWMIIPNGYNESIFTDVEKTLGEQPPPKQKVNSKPLILVHSGVIYPQERDPEPFFQAIADLCTSGLIDEDRVKIILRASGHHDRFQPMLQEKGVEHIIQLEPGIPYRDALAEILQADGLLIFQAKNCNHQIPAKVYEYFRARRPILALTDSEGDTAITLKEAGINDIAPLDDVDAIREAILGFISNIENGTASSASENAIHRSSRTYGVESLAAEFDVLSSDT